MGFGTGVRRASRVLVIWCTAGTLLDLVYELELEKSSTVSNTCHAAM
jgi:hypothetical protein